MANSVFVFLYSSPPLYAILASGVFSSTTLTKILKPHLMNIPTSLAEIVTAFCLLYLARKGDWPSSLYSTKLEMETSFPLFFDLT